MWFIFEQKTVVFEELQYETKISTNPLAYIKAPKSLQRDNADLKISLYTHVHIKIISWKFRILTAEDVRGICPLRFAKCLLTNKQKQNTWKTSLLFKKNINFTSGELKWIRTYRGIFKSALMRLQRKTYLNSVLQSMITRS